ncbi:MAG: DegT/DnrJ/EryC1/StrS family aminotransferase [Candidatus Thermoplasmatota archaeon]|nr:DegT/DnrJ/EryC1/StrS family aminotransferase [Candidatus Thermoplasmatota archaeon]
MINMARPVMEKGEIDAVIRVMESGMLAHGPEVVAFEEEFSRYCGSKYGAAVSSGTSAIHLALAALGIGPGDEVITTSFSFIASATPVLFLGAKPVFTDIDRRTFNMDPESLRNRITDRTKAIIPVHLYGQTANMKRILEIANEIPVLEDCAQAHGAIHDDKMAGSMGKAGMFSFYPTKNMTTGEGGMVISEDEEFIESIRMLRNHGQAARYDHHEVGYNLRMTSISAAIGRVQLTKLEKRNSARARNARILDEGLKGIDGIVTPYVEPGNRHVYHQYTIRVEKDRDGLSGFLSGNGIGNKVFYPTTIPSSPAMKKVSIGTYPRAEEATKQVLSLPVHPSLTEDEVAKVVDTVRLARKGA